MTRMIFVNLPVSDLSRSIAFYEAIGASKNEEFRDESSQAMIFSDSIWVMLLDHQKFATFTPRAIPDAHQTSQMLLCLSAESREEVDATVSKAVTAGGRSDPGPTQDFGFMYGRSFEDPDGHIWELTWMDVEAARAANAPASAPIEA
jgi:predicted lactoylglutathione lyase